MKHVFKWVILGSFAVWVILVTLGIIIVFDRQKRFEDATITEIEFLMHELSETNINASFLEKSIDDVRKTQDRYRIASDEMEGGICGEPKERSEK